MTETYSGPYNPVWGDVRTKKQTEDDIYHPVYPDCSGNYYPSYQENRVVSTDTVSSAEGGSQ